MSPITKLTVFAVLITVSTIFEANAARIGISHFNDVNGQIEKFKPGTHNLNKAPEPCEWNRDKFCMGGIQNLVHWLYDDASFNYHDIKSSNILRLSSGNLIGGESGWISSMSSGWEQYGKLVKDHIDAHALAVGIKEFGAGVPRTFAYMNATVNSTFTTANTCDGESYVEDCDELRFCNGVNKIIKIDIAKDDATQLPIGIIGFTNPIVTRLALPGKLKFSDIVESIQKTVDSKPDIKTFIAIGDGSLEIAKQILDMVGKVKVVIYGSGFSTTTDMTGQYPLQYKHGVIATAGRYGSSVGKLVLDIHDVTGEVTVWTNVSSLVVTNTPTHYNTQALKVNTTFNFWNETIHREKNATLGVTRVELKGGENCWYQECNLGNLMTDAVATCALQKIAKDLNFPVHSIWHGGAFFEDIVTPKSNISKFDVHKWLPYHNNVHLVQVQGRDLRTVFDRSATGIDMSKPDAKNWRQFLQVSSGFEVYYDTQSNPEKTIVSGIRITQDVDGVPQLKNLDDDAKYYLAIPTYLYEQRGVYSFEKNIWEDVNVGSVKKSYVGFDDDCLSNYIDALNVTSVGLEERVRINDKSGGGGDCPDIPCECKGRKTAVTVILTIVFFSIFLVVVYIGYFYVIPRLRQSSNVEYPPNQL